MSVYTQRHQITDVAGRVSGQKMAVMIADCKAGEIARAAENEEFFDEAAFTAWVATTLQTAMNRDVQQYIYTHYDAGTQASFLSLHADPNTVSAAKAAIESVWNWIKSVMSYYYQRKAEIAAGTLTAWDFTQFDATDPGVQLSDFMSGA